MRTSIVAAFKGTCPCGQNVLGEGVFFGRIASQNFAKDVKTEPSHVPEHCSEVNTGSPEFCCIW